MNGQMESILCVCVYVFMCVCQLNVSVSNRCVFTIRFQAFGKKCEQLGKSFMYNLYNEYNNIGASTNRIPSNSNIEAISILK